MPSKKFPSAKATGLIVAGAVALIIAGLVIFVAVSYREPDRPAPITGDVTDIDVTALASGQGGDGTPLGTLDQGRVQFVDRDDPSRVEAEMIYRRINPVGGGFYELDEPQAWIYMKDGRAFFIRANTGRVKMPNRTKSPESGQFVGDVVALLFPPRADDQAGSPRDPMVDAPGLVAKAAAIRFDTQLLEFASDDFVTIETPDVRFAGSGVLVRGNQVLDRIEYLKVSQDGMIRYRVASNSKSSEKQTGTQATGLVAASSFQTGWEVLTLPDFSRLVVLETVEADVVASETDAETTDAVVADGQVIASGEFETTEQPDPPTSASSTPPVHPATAVAAARARQQVAPPVKEDLYEAVFADTVRVSQRERRLSADTLFVWLRTIDNKLPAEAFGQPVATDDHAESTPIAIAQGQGRLTPAAAVPAVLLSAVQSAAQWPPQLFSDGDNDLLLTWAGPLSLRPIAVSPPPRELAGGNHLTLRFSSKADGGEPFVRLEDRAIGARGGCEELEYLATSRDMTMTSGLGAAQVWLAAPEAGCLTGDGLHVNLASGAAEMPGNGLLATLAKDLSQTAMIEGESGMPAWLTDPRPEFFTRTIDWQRKSEFQFRTADGEIRDAIEWAEFYGRAFATDNTASLAGDLIRAQFIEHGEQTSLLEKLIVEGYVEALAAAWRRPPGVELDLTSGGFGAGLMRADEVTVQFVPSKAKNSDVEPTYLLARGGAVVGKDEASMRAPLIEASMARDAAGDIVVTDFEARGSGESLARFDRGDGVWATGDRIKGHAQRQTASVTGSRVHVAHGASMIATTIVELDGIASTMEVYAPGTFSHQQPTKTTTGPASGTVQVAANWSKSMSFDDQSGVLECRGETTVVKDEPLTRDTVCGERIRIELSTAADGTNAVAVVPTGAQPTATGADLTTELGDRRLLRATVFGSVEDRPDGKPATVESRAYAPPIAPGAERTLQTVSYIESARLIADDVQGTIETPFAGRAIVFDQRAPDASSQADQPSGASGPIAGSPRGTSSFRWDRSMVFTRETGLLDLFEKIEIVHKPLDERPLTRMTSDRLQAKLDLAGVSGGGRLIYAEAIGSVYAESAGQRLVGDRIMYNAQAGTALATAPEGGTVTLFDDRRAMPFTARQLRWDLVRDHVEILEPAPIVAPR